MAISKTLRFTILARDGFECVYCHATDKPLEVDHVRPVAMGGTDSPENLVAACEDCNGGKAAGHLGNLESIPRPTVLHQAGELDFLQRRYTESLEAASRAIEKAEAAESARKATAKQLVLWQQKAEAAQEEARIARRDALTEVGAMKRQMRLRGDLLENAARLLDAFDTYVIEQGGDPPPWKDEELEYIQALAQHLVPDEELGVA